MLTRRQSTIALAIGSALSGILAYLVFALTTRTLGDDAAPVSVLWSYWGFAGAALTFPLQHWIARTVTADGTGSVRAALPRVGGLVAVVAILTGGLAWWGRDPLFHRDDPWFPVLVALVTLGSALMGLVRGGLSGESRFGSVAVSLVAENALRCAAVGALVVAGADDPVEYGFCIVAGHVVAICWPRALYFDRGRTSVRPHSAIEFLSGAGLAQLLGQLVLTGGPVALALAGGTAAEVTALFAALALFRAPYTLALGMVAQLTTAVTRLVVSGADATLRRIRTTTIAATALTCLIAGVGGAALGPAVITLVFGESVDFPAGQSAIVAVGCALGVANLVLMITALAYDAPRTVAVSWVVAVAVGAVAYIVLAGLPAAETIVWCFLVAEAVAFLALLVADARRSAPAG
ncbi:polysaccharide biosynthesis protein [Solicola gregarius]|uniref:Polysaccharide biosynthesis protein n=1 Tax=Solicola gregarius TaxID=2908642 RepID=A0AA46TJZ9_9ACTN|nr:hypothetical protein [Solicola gregarius]UYM06528.1 hypothetical protein L0C25_05495 [Solicola gregarius]